METKAISDLETSPQRKNTRKDFGLGAGLSAGTHTGGDSARLIALALCAAAICATFTSFVTTRVSAAPVKPVSTNATLKSPVSAKSYAGISARQTTGWGIFEIKICPAGIRIESQTGAILIAQPPDWTVYIYRKNQKKAAKMSYQLYRTKNRYAVKLSQIREKPRMVKVAGVNALSYSFDVGRPLDEMTSLGSLYRSKQNTQIVQRKEVTFAPHAEYLPNQAKEIWRSYFESPVIDEIPLTTTLYFANGEKRASMDTTSYLRATMKPTDFAVPPGLSFTAQFIEMIYGKEMEGVADLLWE
jgi:hypothetical protein